MSVVGVVGEDFPHHELEFLKKRGVALDGLSRVPGKTFRWKARKKGTYPYKCTLHPVMTGTVVVR